jgi:HPt (histidine-containing phosphotransfer) domain-containing protein
MSDAPGPIDRAALDELVDMTGGDPAFLTELIDAFVADGRAVIDAMERAAITGSDAELQRPAHTLKGNAMNFGATRLAELSRQLEADARSGSVGDGTARVREIADEFVAVEAALVSERETR